MSITKYDQRYYYNKYCKYKMEYLKLKQQMVGGFAYFNKSFKNITKEEIIDECKKKFNVQIKEQASWFGFSKLSLDKLVTYLINTKINLNTFHIVFKNTALLESIYNSSICQALLLIENRDKFVPLLDINLSYDKNYMPPLCAAIYKGYKRCNENKCDTVEKEICKQFVKIDTNNGLNMGLVIDKLLECNDIDILKIYHDCFINEDLNAIDLALLLFDIDTLTKMKMTHSKELDNFLTNNKKKYEKYYNNDDIEDTYVSVLNKYAKPIDLTYIPKLLENDAKELQENKKRIKAEIFKI